MRKIINGRIKVLYLIHNAALTGPTRMVYELAKYSDQEEFAMEVLCPQNGYLSDELKKIGIKIIDLKRRNFADFVKLLIILKKGNYHIFHLHSGQLNAFARIMAKLLRVPALVATEHVSEAGHSWIKHKFQLFCHTMLHKVSNSTIDKIIAISQMARSNYIKRQGIDPQKVITIYNGVDTRELALLGAPSQAIREHWGIPIGVPVVGMIARFDSEKGHEILVLAAQEVLKKNPTVKFLLIGDGPQKAQIEQLIQNLSLRDNFILTGLQEEARKIIGIADIVVNASLDSVGDSFGLSVVEAMAEERVVIVSDLECFREIVRDNVDGFIFEKGNYQELAEKICLVLADPGLKKRIGLAAGKTAANFDIKMTAGKTEALYKEVLLSKGFCAQSDYFQSLVSGFIESIKKEKILAVEKIVEYRPAIFQFIFFITNKRLEKYRAEAYLAKENNFLIETFLQYLEKNKYRVDKNMLFNIRIFKKALKEKKITGLDYDERLRMELPQLQVDNFYDPKDAVLRARIDIIMSFVQPKRGERILDLGCGVGTFSYHCAKTGARSVGVDYSNESIQVAKKMADAFGVGANIEFDCCDAAALPYPDKSFDKIIAADFIEHIDDLQKNNVLVEISRVIKPGGLIIIFTPNGLRK